MCQKPYANQIQKRESMDFKYAGPQAANVPNKTYSMKHYTG